MMRKRSNPPRSRWTETTTTSATVLASIPKGEAKADALALGEAVADKIRCIQPEREVAGRCVADALARLRKVKTIDAVGYLATSLVLATFCMISINALRLAAIASNVAFIVYGYL